MESYKYKSVVPHSLHFPFSDVHFFEVVVGRALRVIKELVSLRVDVVVKHWRLHIGAHLDLQLVLDVDLVPHLRLRHNLIDVLLVGTRLHSNFVVILGVHRQRVLVFAGTGWNKVMAVLRHREVAAAKLLELEPRVRVISVVLVLLPALEP